MDHYLTTTFLLSLLQIIWIDIILSGDNAVVIAMACRGLPESQRKAGIWIGALVAAGLRIFFAVIISYLLAVPLLKVVGGLILMRIAVNLVRGEEEGGHDVNESGNLWKAVWTIAMADAVMSFDNVVAVAGAAKGHDELFIIGLAMSVPLLVVGASLITKLIDRFPILVWFGGGLLGWVAGEMIASDKWVHDYALTALPEGIQGSVHYLAAALGAAIVIGVGYLLKNRSTEAVVHEQKEAVEKAEADALRT